MLWQRGPSSPQKLYVAGAVKEEGWGVHTCVCVYVCVGVTTFLCICFVVCPPVIEQESMCLCTEITFVRF